jgi:predicted transcriptional regulator
MLAKFALISQEDQEKTLVALVNESKRVQELESKLKLSSTSLNEEIKKNYLMRKMLAHLHCNCFKKYLLLSIN